jgi:penicillin-binding protein 2
LASSGFRARSERFLPPDPRVSEPYRLTPQLALRIAVLGALALIVFAILLLRLWALQVLSGTHYLNAAQNNQLRTIPVEAPRGLILDRQGRVLVDNRAGTAVELWPADLPKGDGRDTELRELSALLHVPLAQIQQSIKDRRYDLLTPITLKVAVHEDQVAYIYERLAQFRGVKIVQTYLRHYNSESLLAQTLGYVSEISPEQLKAKTKQGYRAGDRIGQGGVEATYDKYLRGKPGMSEMRVDSLGRPQSDVTTTAAPAAGDSIRLTIDIGVQRAAEQALAYGIRLAHAHGKWAANGGAIIALDPRDGAVLAMASNPTFKPSLYVGRPSAKDLAPLMDPKVAAAENYPALNRVLAGQYPPGSTFKPVTALAAMQEHLLSPFQTLACTGVYYAPEDLSHQPFRNWDPYVNTQMTLPTALAASCDTYFYQVGNLFFNLPSDRGHPLQAWASRFGFGGTTGIDVGPEGRGLLPTPEWRVATYTKKTDPGHWQIDRLWKPGDSIQLAIGQKDMLVTPLQLARFYALIANGGKLVTPYVVQDVEQPGGNGSPAVVHRRFAPPAPQPSGVDPGALQVVRDGLYQATHAPFGTSYGVFGSFPVAIAGKTGTAEKAVPVPGYPKGHLENQAWWCGYGPADQPTIVVCAVIENGGHGGDVAAPAALQVFSQYFNRNAGQIGPVNSD